MATNPYEEQPYYTPPAVREIPAPPVAVPAPPPKVPVWVFVGAGAVLIILAFALTRPAPSEPSTPLLPTALPTVAPTALPTALPTAPPAIASVYYEVVIQQELEAKWEAAALNSLTAMRDPTLDSATRAVFAQKYVQNSLEALLARRVDQGREAQEELVREYETIKRTGSEYNTSMPAPLGIARRASEVGKHALAIVTLEEAFGAMFERGDTYNTIDRNLVSYYVSELYNWGFHLTEAATQDEYALGMSYLATSDCVSDVYETRQPQAEQRIAQLLAEGDALPDVLPVVLLSERKASCER